MKLVKSADGGRERPRGALLGKPLVTHQTGPAGAAVVRTLLVEAGCAIAREFYVGIVLDRAR